MSCHESKDVQVMWSPGHPTVDRSPRTYCSTGCRRLAEHDIRRANGAITALENALQYYRFDGRIKLRDDEQQAAFVASELIAARKKVAGITRLIVKRVLYEYPLYAQRRTKGLLRLAAVRLGNNSEDAASAIPALSQYVSRCSFFK